MILNFKAMGIVACIAVLAAGTVLADTPPAVISATSAGNTGAALNGIAATSTELLFTQPYCAGKQARGIYAENLAAGTSTLTTPLPDRGVCSENYLAISPGLGGFTAGDTFATGAGSNTNSEAVYKNGALFIDGIPASFHHAGVTFDASGTFGFDLIVTSEGSVTGYSSTGVLKFTYLAPAGFVLEGAVVLPLSDVACPGCLYVTAEKASDVGSTNPTGPGAIYFVTPGAASGTPLAFWSATPGPEPEGLVYVGNNLSCSLPGANGAAYSYFVSGYATGAEIDNPNPTSGAVLAYTPSQLAAYKGQLLVPNEGSIGKPGIIYAFSGPGSSTVFSTTAYQLEGSAILQCPSGGCPATFGFWKHHPFPFTSANIGCHVYTDAELVAILNQNNAGGNAVTILGHQLIAAIANYAAGGQQTTAATAAIGAAIALLCANNINLSTSFVQAGSALGQQMTDLANTLDAYNSATGLHCSEGSGLTLGN
jgi:hypothetical protein